MPGSLPLPVERAMTMDPDGSTLRANTNSGVAELQVFLDELEESDLMNVVAAGWTVSAVLAHLAFWDRWVENRWRLFESVGVRDDLPDNLVDLINATAESQWLALSPSSARELAVSAAKSVNKTIQGLDPKAVIMALNTNRLHMLDRSRHWEAHMTEVRRSLE